MRTEFEYIFFEELSSTGKMRRWRCRNKRSKNNLGLVEWARGWRQYTWRPEPFTEYSSGCMGDIKAFLDAANAERGKEVGQ